MRLKEDTLKSLQRLTPLIAVVLVLCTAPAFAEDKTREFMTIWGIFHVGISLAGTVFLLWLIKRGVEKL